MRLNHDKKATLGIILFSVSWGGRHTYQEIPHYSKINEQIKTCKHLASNTTTRTKNTWKKKEGESKSFVHSLNAPHRTSSLGNHKLGKELYAR